MREYENLEKILILLGIFQLQTTWLSITKTSGKDGVKYPVLFRGKTKAEVIEVAEIYRKRTIAMAKREKAQ